MAEINLDNFFKQLYAMGRVTMPSPPYEGHKKGCEYCGRHASINQTCDGCGAPINTTVNVIRTYDTKKYTNSTGPR